MTYSANPLALTIGQQERAHEGAGIVLNGSQKGHLQRHGLVCEANMAWHHPSGAFTLTAARNGTRRRRVLPDGTTKENFERRCRTCDRAFQPTRIIDHYCSAVCFTKTRQGCK